MWACDSSACNAHPPAPVAPATAASWSSQHTQHVAISGPSTPSCPRSHVAPSFPSMRSGATCSFLSKAALEPNLDSLRGTHPPTDTHTPSFSPQHFCPCALHSSLCCLLLSSLAPKNISSLKATCLKCLLTAVCQLRTVPGTSQETRTHIEGTEDCFQNVLAGLLPAGFDDWHVGGFVSPAR